MALDAPAVQEAKAISAPEAVEAPVVAPQTAPVAPVEVVPEGSIKEVLAWVGNNVTKAQKALDAEHAGEKRSTLIAKLEALIN